VATDASARKDAGRTGPKASHTLGGAFDPRVNSLSALRLALATSVLVSHGIKFAGSEDDPLGRLTGTKADLGTVAVDGFFILSGFLITRSYLTTASLPRYLWHRCLRILPGFWVCLLVTAAVFAPLASLIEHGRPLDFALTGQDSALSYVRNNAAVQMRQFTIDGLLGGEAFNGSLYTLFYEFVCYLLLAAVGALAILRDRPGLVVLLTGACWSAALVDVVTDGALTGGVGRELMLHFMLMFFVGASFWLYRHRVPLGTAPALVAAMLLAAAFVWAEAYLLLAPVALGLLLLGAGANPALSRVGRRRDLSYGLYIYAWPVQVLLLGLDVPAAGLAPYLLLSLGLALGLALVSWHAVEAHALAAKSWTFGSPISTGR